MMDIHTATEQAYKNGYAKGYADGKGEPISCGHEKGGEWISVNERLPDGKSPFLATNGKQIVISYRNLMYRAGGTGELRIPANYGNGMTVTHWMPLPELPKGE